MSEGEERKQRLRCREIEREREREQDDADICFIQQVRVKSEVTFKVTDVQQAFSV